MLEEPAISLVSNSGNFILQKKIVCFRIRCCNCSFNFITQPRGENSLFSTGLTAVLPKKPRVKFHRLLRDAFFRLLFFFSRLQWWFMVGCYFYWERRQTVFLFAPRSLDTLALRQWNTHCHAARRADWPRSGLVFPPRAPSLSAPSVTSSASPWLCFAKGTPHSHY